MSRRGLPAVFRLPGKRRRRLPKAPPHSAAKGAFLPVKKRSRGGFLFPNSAMLRRDCRSAGAHIQPNSLPLRRILLFAGQLCHCTDDARKKRSPGGFLFPNSAMLRRDCRSSGAHIPPDSLPLRRILLFAGQLCHCTDDARKKRFAGGMPLPNRLLSAGAAAAQTEVFRQRSGLRQMLLLRRFVFADRPAALEGGAFSRRGRFPGGCGGGCSMPPLFRNGKGYFVSSGADGSEGA